MLVYAYFIYTSKLSLHTLHHLFILLAVLMSNLKSYFCGLILNFIEAVKLLQTLRCASYSFADCRDRSSWILSELRPEHSLLSAWKCPPFCQPMSPATCRVQISPGSWLVFWPKQLTSREERLKENLEVKVKRCEEGREPCLTQWHSVASQWWLSRL